MASPRAFSMALGSGRRWRRSPRLTHEVQRGLDFSRSGVAQTFADGAVGLVQVDLGVQGLVGRSDVDQVEVGQRCAKMFGGEIGHRLFGERGGDVEEQVSRRP